MGVNRLISWASKGKLLELGHMCANTRPTTSTSTARNSMDDRTRKAITGVLAVAVESSLDQRAPAPTAYPSAIAPVVPVISGEVRATSSTTTAEGVATSIAPIPARARGHQAAQAQSTPAAPAPDASAPPQPHQFVAPNLPPRKTGMDDSCAPQQHPIRHPRPLWNSGFAVLKGLDPNSPPTIASPPPVAASPIDLPPATTLPILNNVEQS
ncbi:hypothetical protein HDU96_007345 [Phlyctochytrium bullatum]|nr:hypothetical protein HDU96_007345 [Phlyctochytrium bullatum]